MKLYPVTHKDYKVAKITDRSMGLKKPHYLKEGAYKVGLELNRIAKDFQKPNKDYAFDYKSYLELNNRKEKTIARRLEELRHVLELLPKDAKKATKQDIEKAVLEINKTKKRDHNGRETDQDLAQVTRGKLKLCLKTFYKWLYGKESYPDIVSWIKIESDNRYKLPEEMLNEDEVKQLIEACMNQRDKTIVALYWDTGMRLGELLNLKIKDIVLSDVVSYAMVSGKTGSRRVTLVFSVPYLANYLDNFRKNAQAEDSLFTIIYHNTITNKPIDYPHIRKLLVDLKKRTKIEKRIYSHLFRHSRATYYASTLTEQLSKQYFGWSRNSNMVARYTHLSGRDIDNAILKANGIVDKNGEQISQQPSIKKCLKCQEINEITSHHCKRCGTPLDIVQVTKMEDLEALTKKVELLQSAINSMMSKLGLDSEEKVVKATKAHQI